MMKRFITVLICAAAMMGLLAGCGGITSAAENAGDGIGTGKIKVWVADNTAAFTRRAIADFQEANPQYAGYKVTVESVGEDETANNMTTDVLAGADIYAFSQDRIASLVITGALEEVAPENIDAVRNDNDAGAVAAATVGNTLYAYPLTADNGYFLYYDKSVVRDPSTLEQILSDCEAAGRNFYMAINNGWYQTSFFFATGAKITFETDDVGDFTECSASYVSPQGLIALKEIIELEGSPAFQNGSSVGEATNIGAIIDGTWDAETAKQVFGDNYACAKLPEFTGADGNTYQMSGFAGYKLLGVKPQTDAKKLAACDAIAAYLSGSEVQLARYKEVGWGPSNLKARSSEEVQADVALSALAEQLKFMIPQGQYPGDYWTLSQSLGDSVLAGELTANSSDDDLMAALEKFQETCISFAE